VAETIYQTEVVELPPLAVDAPGAAKLLGLCETTIRQKAKSGEIPSKRIGTRLIFPVDALKKWLAS
jgi:excisionase family DNA binding protein